MTDSPVRLSHQHHPAQPDCAIANFMAPVSALKEDPNERL